MTTPVPLPKTIKASKVLPKQSEYLANLINIGGVIVSRPSLTMVTAKSAAPRGMWVFNSELYSVFGDKLYRGTALTEVGTIAGTAPVNHDIGFTECAIAATSANYTLSTANVLTTITDPDLPLSRDVTRVDGRFVWTPADGSPLAFSDVNYAAEVRSLSFFDAEVLPDPNLGTENIRNDLFVFGAQTIERFRNIGPQDSPFVRVPNSVVEVGYVGGKIKTKDSVIFLGQDRDNGYAFFIFAEGTAAAISGPAINERLNSEYTVAQLEAVTGQRFHWRGADCFAFSLPDRTYLFQSGQWSYIDSGITGLEGFAAFEGKYSTLFNGTWYMQTDEGLVKFDETTHEDWSGPFSRRLRTFARSSDESVFSVSHLELGISQGISSNAGTVGLSLSKNGKLWSPVFYRDIAALGNYDERLRFQRAGGLGRYDGYMGLTLYSTDDIEIAADSMVMGL